MSERLNITISDNLAEAIDKTVEQTDQSKSEVLRKALTMYFAGLEGIREGYKLGLVNSQTKVLEREFIGL